MLMQIIEAAKKRGAEKAKLTKSMIILDVKPWDDTTGKSTAITPFEVFLSCSVRGAVCTLCATLLPWILFASYPHQAQLFLRAYFVLIPMLSCRHERARE